MDFIGGGLPRPPGHPGYPGYPGGLGPFLHTTLNGREWIGGRHADDDSPCRHGIPDNQANGPYPPGGYTCRVTGRPVVFDFPGEETERPVEDTARPRTWPLTAAACSCVVIALAGGTAAAAFAGDPLWAVLAVLGLLGAAAWGGIAAGRHATRRP